jgi:hypothetical protein
VGYRRAEVIATETGARLLAVECHCSDMAAWHTRIDSRGSLGLPDHHTKSWDAAEAFEDRATGDPPRMAAPVLRVDTTAPIEDCRARVRGWIAQRLAGG